MTIDELKARIEALMLTLQQSHVSYNALAGRIEEAKFILAEMEKKALSTSQDAQNDS